MTFVMGGVLTLAPGSDRIPVELLQILTQYAICRLPAKTLSDLLWVGAKNMSAKVFVLIWRLTEQRCYLDLMIIVLCAKSLQSCPTLFNYGL